MRLRLCALAAMTIVIGSGAARAQMLTVSTTQPGSLTHSLGSAVAKVVNEQAHLKMVVQPQGSSALLSLAGKTADFGFSNSYDVVFFVTATGQYEGRKPQKNIRVVARMIPNLSPMLVRASSPYKSVKDLKGKRIPGGFASQKSIRQSILAHLVNAGLTYDDVEEVLAPNVVKSADDFIAGKVEAFTFGLGAAKLKEVAAAVGPLRALPMETDPAAIARMRKVLPGSYMVTLKPLPIWPEIHEPMPIMAFDMTMQANADVPDEVVYKVAKAIHENARDLAATFAGLKQFKPDAMAIKYDHLDYHPGAIKLYQEIGQWPPKEQ
jgi:TRAP transporter TAXI family solute receptor